MAESILLLSSEPIMTGGRARRHSKALNETNKLNYKADMVHACRYFTFQCQLKNKIMRYNTFEHHNFMLLAYLFMGKLFSLIDGSYHLENSRSSFGILDTVFKDPGGNWEPRLLGF